jgi:pantoate kinase
MAATAFCHAYLTGIFTIGDGTAGGAGFTIDKRMRTTVSERKEGGTKIYIGGREDAAPVSNAVIRRFSQAGCGIGALEVRHTPEAPVGFGLGMSAAGALSLSLALDSLLGSGFGYSRCVKIAHDSEVECGTGLSGVDAAAMGGFLAQRSPAEQPVKIPIEGRELHLAFFSQVKTSDIILSAEWKRRVNEAGERALGKLFVDLRWENFTACAREFAVGSGLAEWCRQEMAANPRASMAMVGQTIFSDAPLSLARQPESLMAAKMHDGGAGLA